MQPLWKLALENSALYPHTGLPRALCPVVDRSVTPPVFGKAPRSLRYSVSYSDFSFRSSQEANMYLGDWDRPL